ncbi:transducin beta 3 [Octopus vulgaris]|uniref:Transducin beta 3 n=1 Tax=Octopus vulgaris TaxID=6645 RepID=A0AA36BYF9_OCTVU|nr:transducin beta 3 [Octopus vulgaris]
MRTRERCNIRFQTRVCYLLLVMSKEKINFSKSLEYGPFYSAGKISVTQDHLICIYKTQVNVLSKDNGKITRTIKLSDDLSVTCSQVTPNGQKLAVADTLLQISLIDLSSEDTHNYSWRSQHLNHVQSMKFNEGGNLLATGGIDSVVKVWDVDHRYCTHNFKRNTGIIRSLLFVPCGEEVNLLSGSDNGEICLYNLRRKSVIKTCSHHSAAVTDMILTEDSKTMLSSGRDNIVTMWDTETLTVQKTIPVYEPIESLVLVARHFKKKKGPCFITAGSKGVLNVWDADKGTTIVKQTESQHKSGIMQATSTGIILDHDEDKDEADDDEDAGGDGESIVVVDNDCIISLYNPKDLSCRKQFCGFFDDVLEVRFFGFKEEFMAVASNSENIAVYKISDWTCQVLRGHTEIVIGLDVCPTKPQLLASCSKDKTIRLWLLTKDRSVCCVAIGYGHSMSVDAVAFFRTSSSKLLSVSTDCTVKMWKIPAEFSKKESAVMKASQMGSGHSKTISCVAVSPNDNLFATGSEDHTAKLWDVSSFEVLGVFKGHKSRLTSVAFSPADKCVFTASHDRTVRVWKISDFTTAMVLNHEMPVMKILFLNNGRHVITGCSDGFLNIWNLLTQTLLEHIEAHTEHAWAIDVSKDSKTIVSGGSDSLIRFWQDISEEKKKEEDSERDEQLYKEQLLSNECKAGNNRSALRIALDLDKPHTVFKILTEIYEMGKSSKIVDILAELSDNQKRTLINYMIKWNTHSIYSELGQILLQKILDNCLPTDYLMNQQQYRDLQAYTERHYKRRKCLKEKSQFIPYLLKQMIPSNQDGAETDMATN